MRSDKSQRDKFTTPLTFVTFNKIKVNIRADRKLRNLLFHYLFVISDF